MLMRIFIMPMLLATSLLGQIVPVSNDTASGSPVTVKGTATFDPTSSDIVSCAITGHNSSNHMIVAYMFDIKLTKPDGESQPGTIDHDHFFSQSASAMASMPQPGLDFTPSFDCTGLAGHSYSTKSATPTTPMLHIKLTFVQLDDGSVWGDSNAVTMAMFQRTEQVAYLQSLKAAYDNGGVDGLTQALSRGEPFFTSDRRVRFAVRSKQQGLLAKLQRNGIQAVLDRINSDLAAAQAHAAWLKP
jgi:hypothetical protein